MRNSEQNRARTTLDMYNVISNLRILASLCKQGNLGEDAKRYVDRNFSSEDIEAVQDFYTSINWEIIE